MGGIVSHFPARSYWTEKTNELQQCLRKIDGLESQADLAALEQAQRRWNIVQSAMLTVLDALDTGESTVADLQA
jgi:hypothetical protein